MKQYREKKVQLRIVHWKNIQHAFHLGLCMAGFMILLSGLTACVRTLAEDIPVSEEAEKAMKPERKYPGANDHMVYIPLEKPVLQQWSLDGKKQKEISLPVMEYGGSDEDYSLLWVDNDELIWSVYVDGEEDSVSEGDHILCTPLRQAGQEEEVLLEQTKELFLLGEEDDLNIEGIGDSLEEAGILYVDENRILFFYGGELYEYDRVTKKGPVKVQGTDAEDGFGAVSAMMLGDKMIYHAGRTAGKVEEHAYEFWCYDLTEEKRKSIDNRCYMDAAYVTDPTREKVYYQIIDDQSIWEYDSATGEKKERISEKDFKECYEQNQIPWDDAYYDDLLFVGGDKLYYIKNQENPMLFSYSFLDESLSFESDLTKAVQCSGYLDMDTVELTVLQDKLLLYLLNDDFDSCYLCIDLKTAEIKSVVQEEPEIIYFGMLGAWDASDTRWRWKRQTGENKEKISVAADTADTVEDQIALISSQADVWMEKGDSERDYGYYYAITDLDHNGRLEVIASTGSQGSGGFTSSKYYQISLDGTRLRSIHEEGGSDSDIVDEIKTAFVDTKTDTYYYCVYDYLSGGAGARYIWYGAMVLKDGLITNRTYASGEPAWNKKKTEEVWHYSRYQDGKEEKIQDKKIDEDLLAAEFFDGFEKRKVNISWFFIDVGKKLSKKKIKNMVAKSYNEFQTK